MHRFRFTGGLLLIFALAAGDAIGQSSGGAADRNRPPSSAGQRTEGGRAGFSAVDALGAKYEKAGPHAVNRLRQDWTDADRKRPVPVKIYHPQDGKGPFAIVIFSHGLGGSREGYAYLGEHWASHGFVAVHLEHEGSDADVWRNQPKPAEQMSRAAKDPENAINRPKDVSFAIDRLAQLQTEEGPLKGRLATERIAVAGHSFGAYTALAIVGERGTHVSDGQTLADGRVKVAIPLSPPVPVRKSGYEEVYGNITVPCLHVTGTRDETPIAFTKADDRRVPYDHMTKADQYLITLAGGDHAVFSGKSRRGPLAERDALFQALIRLSTTAFLDSYLNENAEAKAWLQTGGLEATLGANGKLEQKQPQEQAGEGTAPNGNNQE